MAVLPSPIGFLVDNHLTLLSCCWMRRVIMRENRNCAQIFTSSMAPFQTSVSFEIGTQSCMCQLSKFRRTPSHHQFLDSPFSLVPWGCVVNTIYLASIGHFINVSNPIKMSKSDVHKSIIFLKSYSKFCTQTSYKHC